MAEMKKTVVDKTAAKNVATKADTAAPAEVKAEVKVETVKTEEAAPVVKKKPGRKPGSKNAVKKVPAAKKAAEKEEKKETAAKKTKSSVTLELNGYSYTEESLVQSAKDVWVYDLGKDIKDFKSVELYIKPEDKAVYYIINGEVKGSYAL